MKQPQYLPQKNFEIMENIPTSPTQTDYFPVNYNYAPPLNYPMNFVHNPNFTYPNITSPMKIDDIYTNTSGPSPRKMNEKKHVKINYFPI